MTTTVDETFEDEVRAMLARRAADIPDLPSGVLPEMPNGLRISLDPPRPDRRRAALLVAAVLLVVLGAVGVVALTQGDGTREHTGPADAPTRPDGPFPDIPGLPQGVAAEDLLPVWTDPPGPERSAREDDGITNGPLVLLRFLHARLGVSVGAASRVQDVDGAPDWERVAFRLSTPEGDEADEATAYLWWSGESWSVMAVLSSVVVLDELVVDSERMVGSIYGDGPPRVAAIGPRADDLQLDTTLEGIIGVSPGGDAAIVVDDALPDGPITLVVGSIEMANGPPPPYSEIAFDPDELAAPGPTTVPTIPGSGRSNPGVEVVGIPVDAPLGVAIAAALPASEELVAAQHRFEPDGTFDIVELSTVVDGSGYTVSLYRTFDADERETDGTPVSFGRAWYGGHVGYTSLTVESDSGVALNVFHEDPEQPVDHDVLLAIAEMLVNDPTVAAVAGGADPAG